MKLESSNSRPPSQLNSKKRDSLLAIVQDDKNEEEYKRVMDKCHRVKFSKWKFRVDFNPVVTVISIFFIWGFIAWAIVDPEGSNTTLTSWKTWITKTWTWFYIGTQDLWAIFIIYLWFSKYADMKLGRDDEEPEFSDVSYFTMLFAAGIGIGLFYFGVAEPVYHYNPEPSYNQPYGNRYVDRYSDNQQAQDAMNLTLYHWGIHGWIVYVLVGLLLGIIAHRHRLPMTMKTCFYPLIGDRAFGLFGDMIDIISVVATMFGVCTSLGLGAIQFNQGLSRLFGIPVNRKNQLFIIWGITACATASVISGLKLGIRRLSEICFALGMFILFIAFFHGDTWYFMNVLCQSTGYYFQYILQVGFHTDAFAELQNAPDKKENPNWMNDWTIFYWGWWIAWSPFVGMFIARISKGRTIRQFITFTLACPIIYMFLWFSVFGSMGIAMERDAENAGINCTSVLGGTKSNESDNGLYRLSCRGSSDMWFDVMESFQGIGSFLSFISIIGLLLYFVTSSDSGSLVIDCLSANGDDDPPIIQRIFWALTEGACATALLFGSTGEKDDALKAMQGLNICSGIFYTLILNFMCVALWRQIRRDAGDEDPSRDPQWATRLLDPLYERPTMTKFKQYFVAIFFPWYLGGKAGYNLDGGGKKHLLCKIMVLAIPWYFWVVSLILWLVQLVIVDYDLPVGIMYIGWAILMGFFAYLAGIRATIREKFALLGNLVEDFFVCLLIYPLAVIQMDNHMSKFDLIKKQDPEAKPYSVNTIEKRNGNNNSRENPAFEAESDLRL